MIVKIQNKRLYFLDNNRKIVPPFFLSILKNYQEYSVLPKKLKEAVTDIEKDLNLKSFDLLNVKELLLDQVKILNNLQTDNIDYLEYKNFLLKIIIAIDLENF
jgi:hypothetical protein